MQLNKESKEQIGKAIQEFYIGAFEFNRIAGRTLSPDQYENQMGTVREESKELITGLLDNNLGEIVDAIGDSLFTACYSVGILDGSDWITKNAPKYLNEGEVGIEKLIPRAIEELASGNVVDFLGSVEDMCAVINADIVSSLGSISSSNLSKLPLINLVSDPDLVCDEIEAKGRYEGVTYSESTKFGKPCYVFKATYDKEYDQSYPLGKVCKPDVKYGYHDPVIVVYE